MNNTQLLARLALCFAGLNGMLSVGLGGWLAHGGASLPAVSLTSITTAVNYLALHSLVLLALIALMLQMAARKIGTLLPRLAIVFFMSGIVLFCWLILLKYLLNFGLLSGLTPVGGLCLMAGWLLIACTAVTSWKVN